MKKKTKVSIIIVALVVVLMAGAALWYWVFSDLAGSNEEVHVDSVADITGLGLGTGIDNRYAGIVEAQELVKVYADSDKTIAECYVAVGDSVTVGTPLFAYDIEGLELNYEQLKVDVEEMQNNITTMKTQITELKKLESSANSSNKAEYTIQIQTLELNVKQEEYNLEKKQLEVDAAAEALRDNVVKSEIDGVVRSVNPQNASGGADSPNMDSYAYAYPTTEENGQDNAYITIMAAGDLRVKGTISEQSLYTVSQGMPVIVRSRIDENQFWSGTIESIGQEPEEDSSAFYYGGSGQEPASKYPFYVTLQEGQDLLIGQHVYIELDLGQGTNQEGLWLPSYYLVWEGEEGEEDPAEANESPLPDDGTVPPEDTAFDESETPMEDSLQQVPSLDEPILDEEASETQQPHSGQAYVYVANDRERIEKRPVTVGAYNSEMDTYEILEGLTPADYIAYPDPEPPIGAKAIKPSQQMPPQESAIPEEGVEDGLYDQPTNEDSNMLPGGAEMPMIGGADMEVLR